MRIKVLNLQIMKKNTICVVLLITLFSISLKAQDVDYTQPVPAKGQSIPHKNLSGSSTVFDINRLFWGGDLGANFGMITEISFSPLIGYRITDHVEAGIRATYMYFNDPEYNATASYYGGSVFGRIIIINNFFIQAEYEVLNMASLDFTGIRSNKDFTFAGVGFKRPIGPNAFYTLIALWDLNYNYYSSPYSQPDIRIGFNFGF